MCPLMRGYGSITNATDQGPKGSQEDRELHLESCGKDNYVLLAIADGHLGYEVAEYAVQELPRLFAEHRKFPVDEQLWRTLWELGKRSVDMFEGSTISAAHIEGDVAHIAHIGDSPIIVISEDGRTVLSEAHNARNNLKERGEACERGGNYVNGYLYAPSGTGLQLTRALGDSPMGSIIKREPDSCSVKLGPKSVVIICSDGLIDPSHDEMVSEIMTHDVIFQVQTGAEAEDLMQSARERGLYDNATVIVYRHT